MKATKTRLAILLMMFAVVAILLCASVGCTPQQRLRNLLKHHPELITHDTVVITKTITVPEFKADTSKEVNKDVSGVDSIINHYTHLLDSTSKANIIEEVKNYIIQRTCLEDTLCINLKNGGFVKVYQDHGEFKLTILEPAAQLKVDCPTQINNVEPAPKERFYDTPGFKIGWLVFTILLLLLLTRRNRS